MIDLLQSHPFFKGKHIESCTSLENQGYCNENFLLQVDKKRYIVRKLIRDDIDRKLEWDLLNLAYEKGITAKPLLYDEENAFMLFAFLEGEHRQKLSEEALLALVKTLKKLHEIKYDTKPLELTVSKSTDEIDNALKVISERPKEYVLCHNDLNSQNIFFLHDVKLIDFEYAGLNDKYFDLAAVCVEFKLEKHMEKLVLESYFENSYDMSKLEAYKVIYKALCDEWFDNMI